MSIQCGGRQASRNSQQVLVHSACEVLGIDAAAVPIPPPTHAHARSQGQRCVLSNPDLSHSLHGTSLRHLIVSALALTFIRAAGDGGNGRGPRASSRGNLRLTSPQFTSWPVQFPLLMQGNAAGQRIAAAAQPCSCRSHARLQHDPVRRHGGVRCCFCALSRCGRQVHV